MKQIKNFLVIGTIVGSIGMFSLVYFAISYWYENHITEEARYVSANITRTVVNSLFQVMKRGWTRNDLMEFLETNRETFKRTPYTVEIYRGDMVKQLFGEIEQPPMDEVVDSAFSGGSEFVTHHESELRYVYPLKARLECLECHTNARTGDVLGVIDVRQDMGPTIKEGKKKIRLFLLLLFPIPVVGALVVAHLLGRRITTGIKRLHQRIDGVNNIKDLKLLKLDDQDFPFEEFNALYDGLRKITEKLKDIAVDKNVMEFEIRLLEKFIITSELVKDWKEHVSHLIVEINRIIETYCFFTMFVVNEEVYSLEIFWRNTPSDAVKRLFEEVIKQKLNTHPRFRMLQHLHVSHNVVLPLTHLPDLTREDVELQTKTLFLDRPRIGGIVGIGINSSLLSDPTISLVIESILTTLLNVVGSIKAIYKYTKDLEYYATRDPLTDLFNQRVFWEMLEYEIEMARSHDMKLTVMVIDIDNFKVVNDIYGHIFGDKFLQGVASTLRSIFRKEDILARYGGDEFVGILFEADESQAFHVARRIKEGMKEFSLAATDGSVVKTTVSIGFAVYPDHARTAKDLFIVADRMVASGKALGKDRIMVPTYADIADIFKSIGEKNILIINAIEEKRIIPYFQPIINLRNGRIEAQEALMRIQLQEKEANILSAKEFIEMATDLGVINRMEHMLMEKVFRQLKERNYNGDIFINISPKALIFSEFIPNVRRMVQEYNIDPSQVIFEITERDTVKNLTLLEKFVRDLKFEGFKFAIDDFGSGFSSFHYIKRFPIDFLKIEGEFIRSMADDGNVDRAIVDSIISFAKGIGIRTIAEFVENEEILDVVRSAGIDFAQGYHVGEPSPDLITKLPGQMNL